MDDLISRQAAIDKLEELKKVSFDTKGRPSKAYWAFVAAKNILLTLPSATQWISDHRPMDSEKLYLVTLRQKFEGVETYRVRIMRLHEGHWIYPHHFPEWINNEMKQEVVAYIPLPEPYKDGEQDG